MNLLSSVVKYHCPKCRSFKMFKEPFKVSEPLAMHKNCQNCGLDFEPEVGYYWGAMVISYAITSVPFLIISLTLALYFKWTVGASLSVVFTIAALFFFKIARISRSIWIHIFERYDPKSHLLVNNNFIK